MELQVTGTNLEITAVIRRRVEGKMGKLTRHLPNLLETKVELSEEGTKSMQQHYLVRATVSGKGATFHGEERGPDIFQAIDKLATTLTSQIEHYKGKHFDKKGKNNSPVKSELDQTPASAPAAPRLPDGKVVKIKRFVIKPMTVAEAIAQMEALGHDFFLYFDADREELKLVYRRKDGDYGMIEPEIA